MIPNRLLQDGQGALADLVLFERTELSLVELRFWDVHVLTASNTSVSNHLEGYTHDTYLMVAADEGEDEGVGEQAAVVCPDQTLAEKCGRLQSVQSSLSSRSQSPPLSLEVLVQWVG